MKRADRHGGVSFGSAQRYVLGSARGFMGVFYDRYFSKGSTLNNKQDTLLVRLLKDNQLEVMECSSPLRCCILSAVTPRDVKAIVPAWFSPLLSSSVLAWSTIALFLKHFNIDNY
jgi:hypothetical protein